VLAFIAIIVVLFLILILRIAKNAEYTGGNSSFVDDSTDFVSPFHPQKHLLESKPYEDDDDYFSIMERSAKYKKIVKAQRGSALFVEDLNQILTIGL